MPRRKARASLTAEKVLRQAIAEETVALQAELSAANQRIAALQGALASIAAAAMQAQGEAVSAVPASPQEKRTLPAALAVQAMPQADIPETQEPPVDLAGEDNMGAGRWV